MEQRGFQAKSDTPRILVKNSPTSLHPRALLGLTEGLHQLSLHAVGHQRLGQLREEGLHGSSYRVDGEVFLHKVQVMVWGEKEDI